MPQPQNSDKANVALLKSYLEEHTDQQALFDKFQAHGNGHQLAICFTFPPGFTIALKPGKQGSPYAERVMRLCESVNQPDTIKADIWTRTPKNGTLCGIQPGVEVQGTPISPEVFLGALNYTLIAFVVPGPKVTGKKGIVEQYHETMYSASSVLMPVIPPIGNQDTATGGPEPFITPQMILEAKKQLGVHIEEPSYHEGE